MVRLSELLEKKQKGEELSNHTSLEKRLGWNGDLDNTPPELEQFISENLDNPQIQFALRMHEFHKEQMKELKERWGI